jgi:hypothetical protein
MNWAFSSVAIAVGMAMSCSVAAQQWCPPGAKWHHRYSNLSIGDVGYAHTAYAGDTVIDGGTAQRIHSTAHLYSLQNQSYHSFEFFFMYTREANGLVEVWDGSVFDTLFHFNAVPGDGWHLPGPIQDPSPRMVVLDTGHVELGGEWLRYLVLDMGPYSVLTSTDTLYEKLGLRFGFIHPVFSYIADAGIEELRCYKDDQMEVIVAPDGIPCDQILSASSGAWERAPLGVYPNPSLDKIQLLHGPVNAYNTIMIHDLDGRTYLNIISWQSESIDISSLKAGVYYLSIWSNGVRISSGIPWIKL